MTCRLCANTDDLKNLFASLNSVELRALQLYILLATGIQINEDDKVSKLVCLDCCRLVEQIYQYRINSISNNFLLNQRVQQDNSTVFLQEFDELLNEPVEIASTFSLHESVEDLYKQYPNIILAEDIYECNISPKIILNRNETDELILNLQGTQSTEQGYLSELKDMSDVPNDTIIIKEDVQQFEDDENQLPKTPFGNLIIRRSESNNYEVINCIRDDAISEFENDTSEMGLQNNLGVIATNTLVPLHTSHNNAINSHIDHSINNMLNDEVQPKKKRKYTRSSNYICQVCSNLYVTKKLLLRHEKSHLSCKFCKLLILHTEDVDIHENECINNTLRSTQNFKDVHVEQNNYKSQISIRNMSIEEKHGLKLKPLDELSTNTFKSDIPPTLESVSGHRETLNNQKWQYNNYTPPHYFPNYSGYNRGILFDQMSNVSYKSDANYGGPQYFDPVNTQHISAPTNKRPAYFPPIANTMDVEQLLRMKCAQMFSLGVHVGRNSTVPPQYMNPPGNSMQMPNAYFQHKSQNANHTSYDVPPPPQPYSSLNAPSYNGTLPVQHSNESTMYEKSQKWKPNQF